jgi:3-deoxy-D-manno-octulosonic-acid transferase
MRYLYTPLLYLFLPLILVRLVLRGFKNPAYWRRWLERFGYIPVSGPVDLWLHAVSVGEARAAAPIVNALLDNSNVQSILVTTMTPTGSEQVRQLFGNRVAHCYAPYDYPQVINRFLNRAQPKLVLIMETEMWPNVIRHCHRRGISILFANLRLSERSFQRYLRVAGLMRLVLDQVKGFAVQSEPDADRLCKLGARREAVFVTGSIKFEVNLTASLLEVAQVVRREWGKERPVWIAGSTHEGEETQVLATHAELRREHPDLLLVLVPRHPERFSTVTKIVEKSGHRVARRSETRGVLDATVSVYVGDTMGELALLYAASDIAFVGGSLVATGGHNILEPCALGLPVVFGPHMFNFLQISELAMERQAAIQVADQAQLTAAIRRFLGDPNLRFRVGEAGKALVTENKGALSRTLTMLKALVPWLELRRLPAHLGAGP